MPDNWPTDTFADLTALAAKGDGTLMRTNGAWSYVGAPTSAGNLKRPVEFISERRVWAAIVRQQWKPVAFASPAPVFDPGTNFGDQPDPAKFFTGPAGARVDMWATDPTYLPLNVLPTSCTHVAPMSDPRASRMQRTLATCGTAEAATV